MRSMHRVLNAGLIAIVLSGCAVTSDKQRDESQQSSAVTSLSETADHQRTNGNYADAQATLERALRIEPRNPQLWYRLARVQMDLGGYQQAENMALRATSYVGDNQQLRAKLWSLIADARQATGDVDGASDARSKAADN